MSYFDPKLITLFNGDPENSFWLEGYISGYPGYAFSAKVFDCGSEFGINNGRISKLTVSNPQNEIIINYQRGWDIEPETAEAKHILEIILQAFISDVP